jgi:ketosteroid isomerase-like protein
MSQENVEVVRALVMAAQRADWSAAIAPFDPEIVLDQTRMPDGGIYRGAAEVWSFYRRWFGTWDNLEIAPQRFIDLDGDRVLVLLSIRGTGKGSGVDVNMATADLYELRQGRVVRHTGYPDQAEALEAVGLRE